MAKIELGEDIVTTYGNLPALNEKAPHFELVKSDLTIGTLRRF